MYLESVVVESKLKRGLGPCANQSCPRAFSMSTYLTKLLDCKQTIACLTTLHDKALRS